MRVNAEAVQKASAVGTVVRNAGLTTIFIGCVDSERMSFFAREIRLGLPGVIG